MSERSDDLRRAFDELAEGTVDEFEKLFSDDAQWLGVPGSGMDGETPI